ncbi:hypothetical protein DFH09DRAFT_1318684 [Mycena vulgaris]|nr:hypothetical protein DFH09DRAFT_1318684 [Mycena vulgaris]
MLYLVICILITCSEVHEHPEELLGNLSITALQPIIWHQLFDVPPEIWALVVPLAGRQSLGRLCAVSHEFDSIFSPLLYSMTNSPPLTGTQSTLLIKTLAEAHTSSLSPHPAPSIQNIALSDWQGISTLQCLAALKNLCKLPVGGRPMRGSALRTLQRTLPGITKLGVLLRKPGNFPHLKEISVECTKKRTRFDFMQIPNLEDIKFSLTLYAMRTFCSPRYTAKARSTMNSSGEYEPWRQSWKAFGKALSNLSSTSPLLRTLNLKLRVYAGGNDSTKSLAWDTYTDLMTTINQMRFPALDSINLPIRLSMVGHGPLIDFSPFMLGHPSLTNVTLNVDGMRHSESLDMVFLPRLRSFTGSLEQCATMSARTRELEHLTIKLPLPRDLVRITDSSLMTTKLFPSTVGPTLTHLNVYAFAEDNVVRVRYSHDELSALSLNCLVLAFPNITHLDIFLGEQMIKYLDSFAALPGLEYLCIRECRVVEWELRHDPPTSIFPPRNTQRTSTRHSSRSCFTSPISKFSFGEIGRLIPTRLDVLCCEEWLSDLLVDY